MLSKMYLGMEILDEKKKKKNPKNRKPLGVLDPLDSPQQKIRLRHLEELGPNAMKVHQVASCHSLWGFWKVPFPTDESWRGWRSLPFFLHRRISDDNSYFLILLFCQLALYNRIIRIFNLQVLLATLWRQFQMLNAVSGPGFRVRFRVRVRVCFVFTSWLLWCCLVLVGGGQDDQIRSAQVSEKFEMQQTC